MGQIHKIIPEIMRELGAIPRDRRGQHGTYRSVYDVLKSLQPLLVKHQVTLSMKVADTGTEAHQREKPGNRGTQFFFRSFATISVRLTAPDETHTSFEAFGEGGAFDEDKAANKAMSAGFKYALLLGLCVPDEDLADSDRDTPTGGPQDLPARHPLQQAGQQPAAQSVPFDASTPEHQLGEIKQLCQKLKIPREVLDAKLVQRFGPDANVTSLSPQQADELIGQLRGKALELEGKQAFG